MRFSELSLGYYLVDSTMGALCGLTTTNPSASINAKNGAPTLDKQVQEDSTGNWGGTNTADIGQTVNLRTTIAVHAGAQNYVLHAVFSEGFTFEKITDIRHVVPGTTDEAGTVVPAEYYTINTNPSDGCSFEISFTQAFCDHLETNDKVIVFYQAMLDRDAVINGAGNASESWLEFGESKNQESHATAHDITYTYCYGFDLIKTNSQNILIDGAKFKIYDAATGGNEVAVTLMSDGTYRRNATLTVGEEIAVLNGRVRIDGLDNGTYYLEETQNPDGYNKLTARQKFIISDGNLDAVFNDDVFSVGSGVHVVNKAGSMLPETGGLGTLLFTVLGGGAALSTGVVLVTKKRMSKIEDEE
jgi:LPXTG-motif cell wall-anchored protein